MQTATVRDLKESFFSTEMSQSTEKLSHWIFRPPYTRAKLCVEWIWKPMELGWVLMLKMVIMDFLPITKTSLSK